MTGSWLPLETADGSWTLTAPGHGEACHSRSGARAEARARYAGQCRLVERARAGGSLRLLDVGTGVARNLAAALEALTGEDDGPLARLEAVTLERDARAVIAGLELPPIPCDPAERHLERVRVALRVALDTGAEAVSLGAGRGTLTLALGDARSTLPARPGGERYDAVFLDPFSRAREPELWEAGFLAEVARRMAPGSLLSTYSESFAVRLALRRAGLRVGRGASFGEKREGTLASPDLELPQLAARVLARLREEHPTEDSGVRTGFSRLEGENRGSAID